MRAAGAPGARRAGALAVLARGMTGPVNLTVAGDTAWVTEAGVRFRLDGRFAVGAAAVRRVALAPSR